MNPGNISLESMPSLQSICSMWLLALFIIIIIINSYDRHTLSAPLTYSTSRSFLHILDLTLSWALSGLSLELDFRSYLPIQHLSPLVSWFFFRTGSRCMLTCTWNLVPDQCFSCSILWSWFRDICELNQSLPLKLLHMGPSQSLTLQLPLVQLTPPITNVFLLLHP